MFEEDMTEDQIRQIYEWIDEFEFSKPKRNIARDFSDGLLVAELVHCYFPFLVEVHNYYNTTSRKKKLNNWSLLKKKVFKKLQYEPSNELVNAVIDCKNFAVEFFLRELKEVLETCSVDKPNPSMPNINVPTKSTKQKQKKQTENESAHQKNRINKQKNSNQEEDLQFKVDMLQQKVQKLLEIIKVKDEKIQLLEDKLIQYEQQSQ